jgi:hypothetical protein
MDRKSGFPSELNEDQLVKHVLQMEAVLLYGSSAKLMRQQAFHTHNIEII